MTLQYLRAARLVIGQPGNPGQIGATTPASPDVASKTFTFQGQSYPVAADGSVTVPRSAYDALPTNETVPEVGYTGIAINDNGTVTMQGVNGTAVKPAASPDAPTANTAATPGEGLDLSEMRFSFRVEHHTIQTPGSLQVRIYNLSESTASRVQKQFTRVHLSAGYEGNLGTIFNGTVAFTRIGRESGTDTYLDVTAVEADLAHNFAIISQTLAAGSTPNDRLATMKKALEPHGITSGYTPDIAGPALPRGRVLFGMVRDHLRDLAQATGCEWSIRNDQLHFFPADGYMPGPAIVLNSRTGMVGLPEQTDGGVVVKCLLNPAIVPGRPVQIDQKSVQQKQIGADLNSQKQKGLVPGIAADGYYRVLLVQHDGDTRGQNWYTTATCVKLKDPIPKALVSAPDLAPGEFFDQQRAAGTATP